MISKRTLVCSSARRLVSSLCAFTLAVAGWNVYADSGHRRALQPQRHHRDHGLRHTERFEPSRRGADCDRYSEPLSQRACDYGRSFGHAMARSLSSPTGQHDGFLVGYRRGKAAGLADGSGMQIDVTEGRSSVHLPGGSIQRLLEDQLEELRARAAEEGRERGHDDAVRRFEAILDSGRPVDDRLDERALTTTYPGERNVAQRLLPRPSVQEILTDDLGYRQRIRVVGDCSEYRFQQAVRQLDISRSYAVWEMDDAAQWVREDGPAVSAEKGWKLFYHTDAREESPWAMLAVDHPQSWYPPEGIPGNPDLPAIFKQAFFEEYSAWKGAYYSRHFYRALDGGMDLGYNVAYSLARQSTYYQAQAEELDRVYAERSKAAYDAAYVDGTDDRNGYRNSFHDTVETYKTHPVVSLEITGVESLDPVDDGIISPGEPVGLVFTLTNLGLVATPWEGTLAGRIGGGTPTFSGEIAGSARRDFRSAATTIARNVPPREVATLSLDLQVHGSGERLSGSWDQLVHNVVELGGMDIELELVRGSGTLTAHIENTSTLASPAAAFVALTLAGTTAQSVELGTLGGASARTARIPISDQDPLDLIGHRKELELELRMGETVMETATGWIGEADQVRGLADYFDALYGGPVPAFVPPDTDPAQRRERVVELILEVARAEIAQFSRRGAKNIWKTKNGAAGYMVGALARKRLDGAQDSLGDAGYRALGQRLLDLAPTVRGSGKRRAFKKRVYEIEKNRAR